MVRPRTAVPELQQTCHWRRSLSMSSDLTVSVIVSAMNEEDNLRPTVEAVVRAAAPRFGRYETIIVDDGSQDRTAEITAQLSAENPNIRVHRNPHTLGLGRSYGIGIDLPANEYTPGGGAHNL